MGNFSNYWDLTTLFTKIKNTLNGIKTAIDDSVSLKTATGNPITLTDAANANAESLSMTIEPIQDLHGYSKPWAGGAGKNLLPYPFYNTTKTAQGITFTDNEDGTITVNGTSSASADFILYNQDTFTLPQGEYILSCENLPLNCYIVFGSNAIPYTNVFGSMMPYRFTISNNNPVGYGILRINVGTTLNNVVIKPMIRLASDTDPTFEPYTNICPISGLTSGEVQTTNGTDTNTATITFGQTVYGGTVDFKTGQVSVTHGMVDLGDYTWFYTNGVFTISGEPTISDAKAPTNTGIESVYCSAYKHYYTGSTVELNNIPDKNVCLCITAMSSSRKIPVIKDTDYTDAATFKSAMSGVQLCYELATPTTLTLTPAELELLKGNNTITANGAEISIEYYPDNAIGALAEKLIDVQAQINGKQDTLTFDSAPTAGSNNPVTSDGVHEAIAGLDTRVTDLEEGGVFEMITNDRVDTPQEEESHTITVMYRGAGLFNNVNNDLKYLWFVLVADENYAGVNLPGPICIPYALFTDQKTFFTYRQGSCDVEVRRGGSDDKIVWNWVFASAGLPGVAYRFRIYVAK